MDNKTVKNAILEKKVTMKKFMRKINKYTFVDTKQNKLKPFTYTILIKPTTVKTIIDKKIETITKLERGDYIVCGSKGELYGLNLEKVLKTYDIGKIQNKKVIRKGFKLTSKITKGKKRINIIPSWGGKQSIKIGDHILYEFDNKKYYGIEKSAFKKTYQKL